MNGKSIYPSGFKQRINQWFNNRTPQGNTVKTNAHNIYIFPSAFGFVYCIALGALFIGALNYQNSPAFLLVFLMIVIGLFSMIESHHNLNHITLSCSPIEDTEQDGFVTLNIRMQSDRQHYNIAFFALGEQIGQVDSISSSKEAQLKIKAYKRGQFPLPRMMLCSYFSLGLFRVWSYIQFNEQYYVYPKKCSPGFWPETKNAGETKTKYRPLRGEEELYEIKQVDNPWSEANRIAWKVAARKQDWFVKKMTNPEGDEWLFSLEALKNSAIEIKLQQLSYWLQEAEQKGDNYALALKGNCTEFNNGSKHLKYCLRQLAVF